MKRKDQLRLQTVSFHDALQLIHEARGAHSDSDADADADAGADANVGTCSGTNNNEGASSKKRKRSTAMDVLNGGGGGMGTGTGTGTSGPLIIITVAKELVRFKGVKKSLKKQTGMGAMIRLVTGCESKDKVKASMGKFTWFEEDPGTCGAVALGFKTLAEVFQAMKATKMKTRKKKKGVTSLDSDFDSNSDLDLNLDLSKCAILLVGHKFSDEVMKFYDCSYQESNMRNTLVDADDWISSFKAAVQHIGGPVYACALGDHGGPKFSYHEGARIISSLPLSDLPEVVDKFNQCFKSNDWMVDDYNKISSLLNEIKRAVAEHSNKKKTAANQDKKAMHSNKERIEAEEVIRIVQTLSKNRKIRLKRIRKTTRQMVLVQKENAEVLIHHSCRIIENTLFNGKMLKTDGNYAWLIIVNLLVPFTDGYSHHDEVGLNKFPEGWVDLTEKKSIEKMQNLVSKHLLKYLCLCMEETPRSVLRQQHIVTVLLDFDRRLHEIGLGNNVFTKAMRYFIGTGSSRICNTENTANIDVDGEVCTDGTTTRQIPHGATDGNVQDSSTLPCGDMTTRELNGNSKASSTCKDELVEATQTIDGSSEHVHVTSSAMQEKNEEDEKNVVASTTAVATLDAKEIIMPYSHTKVEQRSSMTPPVDEVNETKKDREGCESRSDTRQDERNVDLHKSKFQKGPKPAEPSTCTREQKQTEQDTEIYAEGGIKQDSELKSNSEFDDIWV